MSVSEIQRFVADLSSSAALRAEAERLQAQNAQATPMERAVAFAAAKGYGFTADELKEHAKAKADADGKVLADSDLDGVAGGFAPFAWLARQMGSPPR
jgi:acetamidase/formamidase